MPKRVPAGYDNMAHYFQVYRLKRRNAELNTDPGCHVKTKKHCDKIPKTNKSNGSARFAQVMNSGTKSTMKRPSMLTRGGTVSGSPHSKHQESPQKRCRYKSSMKQDAQRTEAEAKEDSVEASSKQESIGGTRGKRQSREQTAQTEPWSQEAQQWYLELQERTDKKANEIVEVVIRLQDGREVAVKTSKVEVLFDRSERSAPATPSGSIACLLMHF
mmetsp:Transcript_23973/g.46663  ORF Transcript_23973/g.46663 Transcript_23973/m.46663 type:complete len:216 (+) Transcript_23973:61-708(+)